ncbi:MAG: hypothetical protein KTQ49_04990 [Candidatus Omnitrophica bacterium]|nr:hypothetical protein [Candidatus Omnitrophota bacterium]
MMKPFFYPILLVLFCLTISPSKGACAEGAPNEALQRQLDDIKTQLENLEKGQQEIAAKDDKILQELDRLRIWVHRR